MAYITKEYLQTQFTNFATRISTVFAKKTELPTKTSDLTNDDGFITNAVNNLVNYYTKSETYTKDEIASLIASISTMSLKKVDSLPTTDISTTTIYLVPKETSGTDNVYNSSGVITTSDRNKKHDIEEISDDFSKAIIDGLIPSSFKFNDGSSGRTHFGIIAQDLEKLLELLGISTTDFAPLVKEYPDKEVEIENPDYDENDENSQKYINKLEKDYDAEPIYNVRYEEFIMILVKYCQCLKKKDLDLEKRLSELEEKVNTLIAG